MPVLRIFLLALPILLSACGWDGCSGDRIYVRYRGQAEIGEQAPVSRLGADVGYVAAIKQMDGYRLLTLRVQEASVFRRADFFEPLRGSDGKVGLRVRAGAGEPLFDGAEVEADPSFKGRDPRGDAFPGAMTADPKKEPAFFNRPATEIANRAAERREQMHVRDAERLERRIGRAMEVPDAAMRHASPELRARWQTLHDTLTGRSTAEALAILEAEQTFVEELEQTHNQLRMEGNHDAARPAKLMASRLEHLRDQLEREQRREERIGRNIDPSLAPERRERRERPERPRGERPQPGGR